jgi:hypothetical protein
MATLHQQAEVERIKTLLIAGLSRSEIGAQLGLTRSVVCWLVRRMKRDGVALPRSRPGPKPPPSITPPKPVPTIAFEPLAATAAPLLELDDNACRWPVAGEGCTTLFCGAGRDGHPSYCRHHASRGLHGYRRHRNAQSETRRSPSPVRHDLLLVFGRSFPNCDQSGCGTLGRRLSSVYSWRAVVRSGVSGPPSQTATLAQLG